LESERRTGQIGKVQKVKGGQVKSRRFFPFPRRFPNRFAPRSDGRMEGWKAPSFPRWFYFSGRRSLRCGPGKIRIISVRRARERYQHAQAKECLPEKGNSQGKPTLPHRGVRPWLDVFLVRAGESTTKAQEARSQEKHFF
jgi:hypothetical protein